MTKENIDIFLREKERRHTLLTQRKQQLEQLDRSLSSSKFSRSFRSFYYLVKRIFLILVALFLLIGGLFLIFNPEIVFNDPEFKEVLLESYKDEYKQDVLEKIKDGFFGAAMNSQKIDIKNFVAELDKSIEKQAIDDTKYFVKFFGICFILVAFSFLYISRLTRKLKKRNKLISTADTLTQDIIRSYAQTIEEEKYELAFLHELHGNQNV